MFSTLVMETNTISIPMQRIRIVSLVLRVSCFLLLPPHPHSYCSFPKRHSVTVKNPTLGTSLCLRLLPIAVTNTAQKPFVEGRVCFSLQLSSLLKGRQGRNPRQGPRRSPVYLPFPSSWLIRLLPYRTQEHLPTVGTPSGAGPSHIRH